MGNTAAIELEGLIDKPYLRNVVKRRILIHQTELVNMITERVLVKCLIYISGYIKCFTYHVVQPMNEEEIKELLTQECMDWMVDYVVNGGK